MSDDVIERAGAALKRLGPSREETRAVIVDLVDALKAARAEIEQLRQRHNADVAQAAVAAFTEGQRRV